MSYIKHLPRDGVILLIQLKFTDWADFHDVISIDGGTAWGWFINYEGYEPEDMFLCQKDPRGDDYGEIISCVNVFKEVKDDN